MGIKTLDLFSGCGGFSVGFEQKGFDVKYAVEFDKDIAKNYETNHPNTKLIIDDIKNVDQSNYFDNENIDVIIGGPPCQGFSMAGSRIRKNFIDDPRNYLFKHYFNIVKKLKPKVFVIENVKGIKTMQNGKIFEEIKRIFSDSELLEGEPYEIHDFLFKAIDFGIPQKRERVIIIGTKKKCIDFDLEFKKAKSQILELYPSYFDKVTVRDAIGNMPDPSADGIVSNPVPETNYQRYLSVTSNTLYNHIKSKHSNKAIERMSKVECGQNYLSLDENIKSVHSGSYGRLSWDKPSTTITTRFDTPAGGRYTHPAQNRTLTPREAARLQSFPDNFIFTGNKTTICKTIGNAVPPKIAYFLATVIKNII